MKTLIVLLGLLISISAYGQKIMTVPLAIKMDLITWVKFDTINYLVQPTVGGKRVGILSVKVRNYDVYQVPPKGEFYVNIANSNGFTFKMSLGYAFGTHEYKDNTVFFNVNTTKAWIWTVDRYGQLYKMDLPDSFARDARVKK
jgi:hypothetical protein